MNPLIKITIGLVVCIGSLTLQAQQMPMYTHYMYNTLDVNPAYAGSREALTVTALHRSQWVDFKGAPVTQTLTIHTPFLNEHIGIGLSILNDKIEPVNNTTVKLDYAYIMKLNAKAKLALGLSAGASIFRANVSTVDLDQQNDPVFQTDINNKTTPNFGLGAYYSRERFYAGLSVPNLIQNSYSEINPSEGSILITIVR